MGGPYISLSSVTEADRVGHFALPRDGPLFSITFCPLPFCPLPFAVYIVSSA